MKIINIIEKFLVEKLRTYGHRNKLWKIFRKMDGSSLATLSYDKEEVNSLLMNINFIKLVDRK